MKKFFISLFLIVFLINAFAVDQSKSTRSISNPNPHTPSPKSLFYIGVGDYAMFSNNLYLFAGRLFHKENSRLYYGFQGGLLRDHWYYFDSSIYQFDAMGVINLFLDKHFNLYLKAGPAIITGNEKVLLGAAGSIGIGFLFDKIGISLGEHFSFYPIEDSMGGLPSILQLNLEYRFY